MASRRAVGSLIGIGFLLMILAVGVSYINLRDGIQRRSDDILEDMMQQDRRAADEDLDIQRVRLTAGNTLNLTIKNTGNVLAQLEWVGIFDEASNTKQYYRLDASLNQLETRTNIGNVSIVMNPLNDYVIQVLTKLGNSYYGEYPEPVSSSGGVSNGTETQFFYVDNIVDSQPPAAIGSHSLFTAMKAGPDGIMDILTEGFVAGTDYNVTLIDGESFEVAWPPAGWTATGNWNQEGQQAYDGSSSADFDGGGGGRTGDLDSAQVDCSDAAAIYIDFWFYDENLDAGEVLFYLYDGASWDLITDLTQGTEDQWNHIQYTTTDSQYFDATFQIRWSSVSVDNQETAYVDLVTVTKEVAGTDYYDLDLEVSWSGLPSKTNRWLTVYGGTLGGETLKVDYWNGSSWVNVIPSVTSGWNNIDISSILNSSSFIIRFTDSTGIGDSSQNNYEIDTVYLNLWN